MDHKKPRFSVNSPIPVLEKAANQMKRDVEKRQADFNKAKIELEKSLKVQANISDILQEKNEKLIENIYQLDSYNAIIEFFKEGIFNKNEHRKNFNKLINAKEDFTIYFQNSGQSPHYLGCHHAIKELLNEIERDDLEIIFTIETSPIRQNNYEKKEVKVLLTSNPEISRGVFRNITDCPEED